MYFTAMLTSKTYVLQFIATLVCFCHLPHSAYEKIEELNKDVLDDAVEDDEVDNIEVRQAYSQRQVEIAVLAVPFYSTCAKSCDESLLFSGEKIWL